MYFQYFLDVTVNNLKLYDLMTKKFERGELAVFDSITSHPLIISLNPLINHSFCVYCFLGFLYLHKKDNFNYNNFYFSSVCDTSDVIFQYFVTESLVHILVR